MTREALARAKSGDEIVFAPSKEIIATIRQWVHGCQGGHATLEEARQCRQDHTGMLVPLVEIVYADQKVNYSSLEHHFRVDYPEIHLLDTGATANTQCRDLLRQPEVRLHRV